MSSTQQDKINSLRRELLVMEGIKQPSLHGAVKIGCAPLEAAFPYGTFPTAALHEFISDTEDVAATVGFVACLAHTLMEKDGVCVWASTSKKIFPPALEMFGIKPDHIIFIHAKKERDVAWIIEEALKCEKLTAVIGEMKEINLTSSRRFQLAIEQSKVTGFLLRNQPRDIVATACMARWRISSIASQSANGLPGLCFPCWNVELQKVRSGRPGNWRIEWHTDHLEVVSDKMPLSTLQLIRKAG